MTERKKRLLESRRDEKDEAARWLADNPGLGSFPGKRSETGESDEPDRYAGQDPVNPVPLGRMDVRSRGQASMDAFGTPEEWERWALDHGIKLVKLGQQSSLTPEQLVTRARVEHLLTYLTPEHVELLLRYHGMKETQDALAEEHGVSRQAIQQRLRVAEEDFRRVFVEHWEEDYELR